MLKVECEACKAPYQVDERRVPPTGLKMRCPKCGHSFTVANPNFPAPAPAKPAPPAAPPRPPPKMTMTGVGVPSVQSPNPADDIFGDLPAAKPAPPAFGQAGVPRPAPPAPPRASPPALDGIDELTDLPAIPDDAGLPVMQTRSAGKPPFPGAKPAGGGRPQPPSLADFDIDLPSADADLPSAKAKGGARTNQGMSFDVDLPSPAADLPSAKPGGRRDQADLPAVAAVGLPATKTGFGFGEIDLPSLGGSLPAVPARDHNLPVSIAAGLPLPVVGHGLPVAVTAGLPSALGGDLPDVANALPNVANALPQVANALPVAIRDDRHLPSAMDSMETDFGELELKSVPPAAPGGLGLGEELDLPPSREAQPAAARSTGGAGFGEVDLGGDSGDAVAMEDVVHPSGQQRAVGAAGGGEAALPSAPTRRREKAGEDAAPSKAPKLLLALGVVILIAGSLMELTPYGAFGRVAVNDLVHEGGWARLADEASTKTRLAMAPDTYDQTIAAMNDLATAHAESPHAKPLSAYAALAEFETELRFGKDGARAARAQSWLSELTAKGAKVADIHYFAVAAAAQAAVNGDLSAARAALDGASKRDVGDPIQQDIAFIRGEVELAAGDPAAATAAFTKAAQLSPGARAHFGLARAYALGDDLAKAKAEIAAALAASPHDAGALVLRANVTWATEKNEAAAMKDLHEVLEGSAKSAGSPLDVSKAHALVGWMLASRGKTSDARDAFETALKLDARNADALVGQGEALYTEGRNGEALSRFDRAVEVEPRNVRAIVADAKAKIALERLADAKAQLTAARTTFPTEMRFAFWLGKVENALGNKKAAEDAYLLAIGLANPAKPEAVDPYVALAEMLAGQGRAAEAQTKLNEAKSKLPDSAAMQRALGEVAGVQGLYDEAIGHYQAAIQKDPADMSSHFLLGVTYRRMQRIDLASAELDKVFAVDKDYPNLAMERGLLFEQSGQIEKALDQFRAALAKAPDDLDLQLRVGAAYVGVHHADDALQILRPLRDKRQNSAEVNHYLGRAYFQKGGVDLAAATRFLKRAVELDPNRAEYHLYLAWVATEASPADVGTAQTEVEKALAIDKLYAEAYWQRGVVERINSSVDDAIKDLKHALQLKPTLYQAHATLAECYEDKSNYADATSEWNKAIAGDDQRPEWRWHLGSILFDKGKVSEALPHLVVATKAAETQEHDSNGGGKWPGWGNAAEFKVAEAYRKNKNRSDAIDHFNVFLDHAPSTHPDRREAMSALAGLGAPRDH